MEGGRGRENVGEGTRYASLFYIMNTSALVRSSLTVEELFQVFLAKTRVLQAADEDSGPGHRR